MAKLILYISIIAVFFSNAYASSESPQIQHDYESFKRPLEQEYSDLDTMVETFQKPLDDPTQYAPFRKEEKELINIYEKYYGKNDDVPIQQPHNGKISCDNAIKVDYYFSFSMPESSIYAAVEDALALRKKCVDVNMHLRGLIDNDFTKTIKIFYGISKANPEDLPIEIDPKGFKHNNVIHVPTVLIGGKRFVGDMRLSGIMHNLDRLKEGTVAATYPVKELDIAELIKRRAHLLENEMNKFIESGTVAKKFILTHYDKQFNKAEKKKIYYIDPTYTVPKDILDHRGIVVIKAGTSVNPLDMVKIGKYIFINGNHPEEVKLALQGNYRSIILMSGDALKLGQQHHVPFYHVNDELIQLFQIKRVPLIIEQEGRLIRATEQPI